MWAISGSDLGQISPIIWTPPFPVADIDLIGGKRAMLVDSITRGDIHTFVRPIFMWHVPDDKHSRTYWHVAVHRTRKCGLPQWCPWLTLLALLVISWPTSYRTKIQWDQEGRNHSNPCQRPLTEGRQKPCPLGIYDGNMLLGSNFWL